MRLRILTCVIMLENSSCRDSVSYFDKLDGYKNELYVNDISLFSHDCLSIGYFLASIAVSYKEKFAVDLGGCRLGDMCIKIFIQSLPRV